MENMRYEKTGRITLIGFVLFSLLVLWVVNTYFIEEKKYIQKEVEKPNMIIRKIASITNGKYLFM